MEQEPSRIRKPKHSNTNAFLRFSGLGIQLLIGIGLAAWLGHELDQRLQLTFPLFLLLFVFLAFGGMLFQLYRSINK